MKNENFNLIYTFLVKVNHFCNYKIRDIKRLIFWFFNKVPLPLNIVIETGNICNLKCSLCPTGLNLIKDKGYMSFENFKTIINKFPKLLRIELYNWGEPFLNPQIFEMIIYAKNKNIQSEIHTNFSFIKEDVFFEKLAQSGLNYLTISLDGASQETYTQFRINGCFDTVINNIKKLKAAKNKFKTTLPKITWKFIVNKYNEHEIEAARNMAIELGIVFKTALIGLSEDVPDISLAEALEIRKNKWLPKNIMYIKKQHLYSSANYYSDDSCPFLFSGPLINYNGDVYPCCLLTQSENAFGNILNQSLEEIWNNQKFRSSRALFSNPISKTQEVLTICKNCNNYKKKQPN